MTRSRALFVTGIVFASVVALGSHEPGVQAAARNPISWAIVGDSYSSGEGEADAAGDCAQSDNAYGRLAARQLVNDGWPIEPIGFAACTGNVVADLFNDRSGEGTSQWDVIRDQTEGRDRFDIITMSFGGNDLAFSGIIESCLYGLMCTDADELNFRIHGLLSESQDPGCDPGSDPFRRSRDDIDFDCPMLIDTAGEMTGGLIEFYRYVAEQHLTDNGRLYVVDYPKLFTDDLPFYAGNTCQGVRAVGLLNEAARVFNDAIEYAIDAANDLLGADRVVFVDREALYADGDHSLCGDGDTWLNGISLWRSGEFHTEGSFHPNTAGHEATAGLLIDRILQTFDPTAVAAPTTTTSTTTSSTTTTVAPTTTIPTPPDLSAATNASTALWQGLLAYSDLSPVVSWQGTPITISIEPGGDNPPTLTLWMFDGTNWNAGARTSDLAVANPDARTADVTVQLRDLTGDGVAEVMVSYGDASMDANPILTVLPVPGQSWGPAYTFDGVGALDGGYVNGNGTIQSTYNTCDPSCADSNYVTTAYRFDGANFVGAGPGTFPTKLSPPAACGAYTDATALPLQQCQQGTAVGVAQWHLGEHGYLAADEHDGMFGPATFVAVEAFQLDHGLPASGVIDADTWRHLLGGTFEPGQDLDGDGMIGPDELNDGD